ncbi:hypothetical protein ACJIZ3_016613 [Penstemon smallii]|uniref:Uncharacterized protein n=1 Tax=Penstemon smallii TaxID=265156 RepID=A0ABD3ST68_9LAMI
MVKSISHNVLDVYVQVTFKCQHVFVVSDVMDWIMQWSIEEAGLGMLPATDSSIEFLESKIVDGGSC